VTIAAATVVATLKFVLSATCRVPLLEFLEGEEEPSGKMNG